MPTVKVNRVWVGSLVDKFHPNPDSVRSELARGNAREQPRLGLPSLQLLLPGVSPSHLRDVLEDPAPRHTDIRL